LSTVSQEDYKLVLGLGADRTIQVRSGSNSSSSRSSSSSK